MDKRQYPHLMGDPVVYNAATDRVRAELVLSERELCLVAVERAAIAGKLGLAPDVSKERLEAGFVKLRQEIEAVAIRKWQSGDIHDYEGYILVQLDDLI